MRIVDETGEQIPDDYDRGVICDLIGRRDSATTLGSLGYTYGVRPVFTLKNTIKVVGGTGEQGDPYILSE